MLIHGKDAVKEIAIILCGPQISNSMKDDKSSNLRDLRKEITFFTGGYFFIHKRDKILIHPYGLEGHKVDLNEPIVKKHFTGKKVLMAVNDVDKNMKEILPIINALHNNVEELTLLISKFKI